MNYVPELRVEVIAGAVPTPFVEQGPEGFDVKGDAVARRDCLAHVVGREAIRKIELVIKSGLCSVAEGLGCQTKAGEGSEIVVFDPVHDARVHFLGCGRGSVVHFPLKVYVQRGTEFMGDGTSYREWRVKRRANVTVTRVRVQV